MQQHLLQLLNYEYWANNLVFDLVKNNPTDNERVIIILHHIFEVQRLWFARLGNEEYQPKVFEVVDINEIESLKGEARQLWRDFLLSKKEDHMNDIYSYKNIKGESFSGKLKDIITHVVNHSEHHRAEIITLLKTAIKGIQIPQNDYIFYLRLK